MTEKNRLAEYVADSWVHSTDLFGAGDLISRIADDPSLSGILSGILSDGQWLDEVAQKSYRHPNGFVKLVLLESSGRKLRLHLWRMIASGVEDIHNHRWSFATRLIRGSYRLQLFAEGDQGTRLFRYRYSSAEGAGSFGMESAGVSHAALTLDAVIGRGCGYSIASSQLHRVLPAPDLQPDARVISLLIQGPVEQEETLVLSTRESVSPPELEIPRLSHSEVHQLLVEVQSELDG